MDVIGSIYHKNCNLLKQGICADVQVVLASKLKVLYDRALYGAICAYVPFAQDVFESGTVLDDLGVGYLVEDYISTFGTAGDSIMPRFDILDDMYLVPLLNMKVSAVSVSGCEKNMDLDVLSVLDYIFDTPEERILDGVANFQNNDDFESWFNKTQDK